MTRPKFDQDFWEQLREHADKLARRPPNAHLMAEAADLPPGRERTIDVRAYAGIHLLSLEIQETCGG